MTIGKKGKLACLVFVLLGISLFFPLTGQADTDQDPAGFTVESVIPENQVDKEQTYYYLKLLPEQKQTIQVKVISTKKEPVTVGVAVHDAISSSIGAIDYAAVTPKLDASLKNPLTNLVKIKDGIKEVTVQNFEEKIIEYEITMPKAPFSGVKLGSLRFVKKAEESTKKQTGLAAEYARVIALMVTENEDKESFHHGAELHLKSVRLDIASGRKVIAAKIQNDQPKVLKDMTVKGSVRKKGETTILAAHEMDNYSVAPNSNFDFTIPLGLDRFLPGTYVFTGEAKGDGRTWKWEKEFTVGRKIAEEVNNKNVYTTKVPDWVPWAAALLILSLIGLLVYLTYRKRSWHERK